MFWCRFPGACFRSISATIRGSRKWDMRIPDWQIGAFEICNVFWCKARSIPCEVRTFSVVSKKDENLSVFECTLTVHRISSGTNDKISCSSGQFTNWPEQSWVLLLQFILSLPKEGSIFKSCLQGFIFPFVEHFLFISLIKSANK